MGCHVQPEQFFNLIFGYNDQQAEEVKELNAASGNNTLDGTPVPSDEIWILLTASVADLTNAPSSTRIAIQGTFTNYIVYETSPAAGKWDCWSGFVVMKEGDKVRGVFTGVTLNDDLYLRYLAVKMKISQ